MRFDRPLCPVCRRPASAVVSQVSARTELSPTGTGTFERTGRTILEASESPCLIGGRHLLVCACGEGWLASRLDEEGLSATTCGGLPPFCPDEPGGADSCVIHLTLESEPPAPRRRDLSTILRERVRTSLAARPATCPADPPPCYDELFFEGTEWLDSM